MRSPGRPHTSGAVVVEAAVKLLRQDDPDSWDISFTAADVASAAKLTPATISYHLRSLPTKGRRGKPIARFWSVVAERGFRLLRERISHAQAQCPSEAHARIRAGGEAILEFADEYPGMYRLVNSAAVHKRLESGAINPEDGKEVFDSFLVPAREVSPRRGREFALALWLVVHGLATANPKVAGPLTARKDLWAHMLDSLLLKEAR